MADICVIFASDDEKLVEKLVALLRIHWDVWWTGDLPQGDWEKAVLSEIRKARAVIPVISRYTETKDIFRDELQYAKDSEKLIFPFFIDKGRMPLGFGGLNRTDAIGWDGSEKHSGYQQLLKKVTAKIGIAELENKNPKRMSKLELRNKTLQLPCFVFSLSSHETQVSPKDGINLLQFLGPAAGLISAYDSWKYYNDDRSFKSTVGKVCQTNCVLFLDSGNYEASRKNDHHSRKNEDGWRRTFFRQVASELSPDIVFAFDDTNPKGGVEEVAGRIITNFCADERAIANRESVLCPIIHLPRKFEGSAAECASSVVEKVVKALDPVMVAIPERELGDGLLERTKAVRDIRMTLDSLGKYYPLHLLGTGNPISMIALAAAGADSFDGLEWCRTVADYDSGNLFHFQHFDCFWEKYIMRLQSEVRTIVEAPEASYGARVASYNIDFYNDWTRTMYNMIHSGQIESLLKYSVPNIGPALYKALSI